MYFLYTSSLNQTFCLCLITDVVKVENLIINYIETLINYFYDYFSYKMSIIVELKSSHHWKKYKYVFKNQIFFFLMVLKAFCFLIKS